MTTEQPTPEVLKVSILGSESIIVGFHLSEYIVRDVLSVVKSSTYVLITDTHLEPLYLDKFKTHFETAFKDLKLNSRLLTYVLPPGELSKSRVVKGQIEDYMLGNSCTRDTCVIAMGGGVIGDLVGFVASTFMRGVPFIQIPTTLLAMVDSSIGGKTAIDTPHGKNLIGAFWQPERIFIDLSFLQTLPEREFINGMAEVIKTAAIWNENDFSLLENGAESIRDAVLKPDLSVPYQGATKATRTSAQTLLQTVVLASAAVKAHVVTNDERESDLRGLLNFGHSVGHAIEALVSPRMLHGECVSIGMVKEAEIARYLGHLSQVAVGRLTRCLQNYGLPVSLDEKRVKQWIGDQHCSVEEMLEVMKVDKKNIGSQKRIVMLSTIGKTLEPRPSTVSDEIIHKVLCPAAIVMPKVTARASQEAITITVPGSKSISNRALVLAALGSGICRVKGLLHSDDTQYMLQALKKLGSLEFEWEDNGDTLVVNGGSGRLQVPSSELYLGNAGTAARFLTTVCTLIPTVDNDEYKTTILTGNDRMKQRPIGPLVEALCENGSQIKSLQSQGCLPLEVTPIGGLKGGTIRLAASISSQYVSSILMCAPYAREPITLELTGGVVISQLYIDMTIAMMKSFGVEVERVASNIYKIPQAVYKNPEVYVVEADASSATYPLAVAAITGTKCTLSNIGNNSLQGDAGFAMNVLKPMGCDVSQTGSTTTVQGPPVGTLKPLPSIDMESMTDAFLTAAVLAAVTSEPNGENITRITGIANQRVKECNRIAAMVKELGKFGVKASELPDGIQIHGTEYQSLRGPKDGVDCYDDHRVAMSFSVLGCTVPGGTVIREKKCVEKTWPGWWDALENILGVETRGFDLVPEIDTEVVVKKSPEASIVLIGMRGAGKTTLGRAAASALSRQFVDMDHYLEEKLSTTIPQFIETNGWVEFREKEAHFLVQALEEYSTNTIIACGGGIVETPSSCEILKKFAKENGHVVQIQQDIEKVKRYLEQDTTRPMYGQDMNDVWERRKPLYESCSNYEFVVSTDITPGVDRKAEWNLVERDFIKFVQFVLGQKTNHLAPENLYPSYFLSLTYGDLTTCISDLPTLTEGVDALELRVDLLTSPSASNEPIPSIDYIANQLSLLRRHSSLPVIFTVRSQSQGGKFPNNAEKSIFDLWKKALRWGCEYIDVELGWNMIKTDELVKSKGNSQVIASWHDVKGEMKWDGDGVQEKYNLASKYGDIVKLISVATTFSDNFACQKFVESKQGRKPTIAINMGPVGQLSRVLNPTLTPVTHPLMPNKAAPGQLSVADIHQSRTLLGLITPKQFFLFGTPISHSMSPTLHNAGFQALGLPHHYSLYESSTVEPLKEVIQTSNFGGASITIPHKLDIMPLLDEVTETAQAVGAVNTIIVKETSKGSRQLIGDNTDWLGIYNTTKRALPAAAKLASGLVIGAGGTSRAALYALHKLGVNKIFLFNRTHSKAQALANECKFEVVPIDSLDQLESLNLQIIISTIPADGTDLELPDHLFRGDASGVAVELAYKPRRTPFLKKAESVGWSTVEGVQILIEQGLRQFESWTGRHPPRAQMEAQVISKFDA
ncbi:3-dehydroquinate dehydratase (3-dehydroquinase) [Basidiobolus ranarum]|uniref:Pentafunctional AROM polypeptide n=1 Tax=Basidiobolus ranarum TaxID=34480 RepID=A0ABR2W711_9FUNG